MVRPGVFPVRPSTSTTAFDVQHADPRRERNDVKSTEVDRWIGTLSPAYTGFQDSSNGVRSLLGSAEMGTAPKPAGRGSLRLSIISFPV